MGKGYCSKCDRLGRFADEGEQTCASCTANLLIDSDRMAFNAGIDAALEIFEKAFENNWEISGTIDQIKALKKL